MRAKVGDLVYDTPQSPGKVREVLPDGYMIEWLTKGRGITKESRWVNKDFEEYVAKLKRKYLKYQKKLDKLKNMP